MATASAEKENRPATSSSQNLSVISDFGLLTARNPTTPGTARFPSLQSPCFYHERFDDAVNIDKVLEEIKEDAGLLDAIKEFVDGKDGGIEQQQGSTAGRDYQNAMVLLQALQNNAVSDTVSPLLGTD